MGRERLGSPWRSLVWYYSGVSGSKCWRCVLGRLISVIVAVLAFANLGSAADLLTANPARAPEEVVRIQLEALQRNNEPTPDAGIRQTWELAHPNNKQATGPLPRFAQMIKGRAYLPLIDHVAHDVEELAATEQEVAFKVTIETPGGDVLEYLWAVGLVLDGPAEGAWMTTSVAPPRAGGRAI